MVLTTTQLRRVWDPPCKGSRAPLAEAYNRLDDILKNHDYKPRSGVTGAYNCRRITGGTGYSLHAYGPGGIFTFWSGVRVSMAIAVDINWDTNPYSSRLITDMPRAMIDEIKALRTNNGQQVWGWGGDYGGNKDAMHYEIVCSPDDLKTGIRKVTPPPPHSTVKDNHVYALIQAGKKDPATGKMVATQAEWYLTDHMKRFHVLTQDEAGFHVYVIRVSGGVCLTSEAPGVWPQIWPEEVVNNIPLG